jgi:V/A-type H+-transporting ATPase subunit F
MTIYLISDNIDTQTGMRLAGIEGCIVHTKDELKAALDKVLENKDIGILLITEKLSMDFPELVNDIKSNRKLPLLVEIPDRHGSGRRADFITSYVNDAIGLKL